MAVNKREAKRAAYGAIVSCISEARSGEVWTEQILEDYDDGDAAKVEAAVDELVRTFIRRARDE